MLATVVELLGQRSQQNSWLKHLFGLYLFATGTQRQTIAVLSSWGVCSSYSTLAGTQNSSASKKSVQDNNHDDKSESPSATSNLPLSHEVSDNISVTETSTNTVQHTYMDDETAKTSSSGSDSDSRNGTYESDDEGALSESLSNVQNQLEGSKHVSCSVPYII